MTTRHSILMNFHGRIGKLLTELQEIKHSVDVASVVHSDKDLAVLGRVNYQLVNAESFIIRAGQSIVSELENDTNPTAL